MVFFLQGLSWGGVFCASSDLSDGYKKESILNSTYCPSPPSVPHEHRFEGKVAFVQNSHRITIHEFICLLNSKHVRAGRVLAREKWHANTVEYFQYGGSWGVGWRTYREVHRLSILLSLFLVHSVAGPDSSWGDPKQSRFPLLPCKII